MRAFQHMILLAGVLPGLALADSSTPTVAEMKKVFSPDNQPMLCQNGVVDAGALLGQLHIAYDLNPYAMPRRNLPDGTEAVPAALRSLDWMLLVNSDDLVETDLREGLGVQHERLVNVGTNLVYELKRLQEAELDAPFQLTTGGVPVSIDTEPQRNRALRRLFAPLLGTSEPEPLAIRCVSKVAGEQGRDERGDDKGAGFVFSVRGKHEDLAVARTESKTGYQADLYKLASSATLAFTDNDVPRVETTKAEAALGISRPVGGNGFGTAFIHYLANASETATGDDDDSKDTNAFSYGVMYRRDFEWGDESALLGAFSASVFETMDHAQDSKLVRGRVAFSDLSFSRLGNRALCGVEATDGPFWYQCRVGLFAEYGRVQDAGSSLDYQTLEDDTYTGIGLDFGFAIAPLKPAGWAPLTLTLNYRYMNVVSGDLEDPEWWSAKLSYDIPKSNLSIGLLYEKGENAVTFEDVETTTVNFGFKY